MQPAPRLVSSGSVIRTQRIKHGSALARHPAARDLFCQLDIADFLICKYLFDHLFYGITIDAFSPQLGAESRASSRLEPYAVANECFGNRAVIDEPSFL